MRRQFATIRDKQNRTILDPLGEAKADYAQCIRVRGARDGAPARGAGRARARGRGRDPSRFRV